MTQKRLGKRLSSSKRYNSDSESSDSDSSGYESSSSSDSSERSRSFDHSKGLQKSQWNKNRSSSSKIKHRSKNLLDGSLSEGEVFLERDLKTIPRSNQNTNDTSESVDEKMKAFVEEADLNESAKTQVPAKFEGNSGNNEEFQKKSLSKPINDTGIENESNGLSKEKVISQSQIDSLNMKYSKLKNFLQKIYDLFQNDPQIISLLNKVDVPEKSLSINQIDESVMNLEDKLESIQNQPVVTEKASSLQVIAGDQSLNNTQYGEINDSDHENCSCPSEMREICSAKSFDEPPIKKLKKSTKLLKHISESSESSGSEESESDESSNDESDSDYSRSLSDQKISRKKSHRKSNKVQKLKKLLKQAQKDENRKKKNSKKVNSKRRNKKHAKKEKSGRKKSKRSQKDGFKDERHSKRSKIQ